jgi:HK97 family phage major capsid protein
MNESQEIAEKILKTFEDYKTANDGRLNALEKGVGTADKDEQLTKMDGELNQLKQQLSDLETKGNRLGGLAEDAEKEEYRKGFEKFMRKGDESIISTKSINTSTDADGGFAVPEELDREVIKLLREDTPMREVAAVRTISTPDYKKLVSLGGAASGWVDEDDARPETPGSKLAAVTPFMGELYANPAATQQSLDDLFFDVSAWLAEEVATEFAEQENVAFTTGVGVKKPKGFLAYTLSTSADSARAFGELQKVHSGVAGNFDLDNIYDLTYALKKKYRKNAVLMGASDVVKKLRKLKNAQGDYLWQPNVQAGQPDTFDGRAFIENEDMPDIAADANAVAIGDFKRGYLIVDRIGTRILRDPFTNKPYVHFYTTKRVGGAVVDSQAIKVLTLSV